MGRSWTGATANYPWVKTYTASAAWIYECIFKDSTIVMDYRYVHGVTNA
jgi:hypothetical protein